MYWRIVAAFVLCPWPALALTLDPASGASAHLDPPFSPHTPSLSRRRSAPHEWRRDDSLPDQRPHDFFHFVTRPDIGAPKWSIKVHDRDALAPGYWFLAPYAALKQVDYDLKWNGPHIYDDHGELIWSGASQFEHLNVFDFRTVEVNGTHPYVSLMLPSNNSGVILDSSYERYANVDTLGPRPSTNMHEFTVFNDGTRALILTRTMLEPSRHEGEAIGFHGECKAGWEGFKEVRVDNSEVIFNWTAVGHIGLDESTKFSTPDDYKKLCTKGWDSLHLNALDKFPDGDYLLSSRHTDTLYKISHVNGSIVWRLGGVKSDFTFSHPRNRFSRQHHARVRSQNDTHVTVSLFDNTVGNGAGEEATGVMTRGLVLSLDTRNMVAHLERHFDHPEHRRVNSRGSLSFLPNGNAFLCWTYGSLISEHDADGRVLMEAHFKYGLAHTYRAYKLPWTGRPSQPPDVLSTRVDFGNGFISTLVHVSWNGATDVDKWKVYRAGRDGRKHDHLITERKTGFETLLWYNGDAPRIIAEAVDADGNVLGQSKVIHTTSGAVPTDSNAVQTDSNAGHNLSDQTDSDVVHPDSDECRAQSSPVLPTVWGAVFAALAGIASFCISTYLWSAWPIRRGWWRSEKTGDYRPVFDQEEEVTELKSPI